MARAPTWSPGTHGPGVHVPPGRRRGPRGAAARCSGLGGSAGGRLTSGRSCPRAGAEGAVRQHAAHPHRRGPDRHRPPAGPARATCVRRGCAQPASYDGPAQPRRARRPVPPPSARSPPPEVVDDGAPPGAARKATRPSSRRRWLAGKRAASAHAPLVAAVELEGRVDRGAAGARRGSCGAPLSTTRLTAAQHPGARRWSLEGRASAHGGGLACRGQHAGGSASGSPRVVGLWPGYRERCGRLARLGSPAPDRPLDVGPSRRSGVGGGSLRALGSSSVVMAGPLAPARPSRQGRQGR